MPMATKYIKGKLYKLLITDLLPDPEQARKFMDPIALNELTASILKLGVLTPIQFRQDEQAALVIVSGHRRTKAAAMAGLKEISGTFTEGDTRLQGFVENLQREDLRPIDEAEEMAALMKEYAFNQYQLADAIGKSQPVVSATMTLNNLPLEIRDTCRTNPNISKNLLLEVAKMKTEGSMRRKFKNLMAKTDKTGKQVVRKAALSKQRALIEKLDGIAGELDGLPWRDWSEDDRNDLTGALVGVHSMTRDMLTDMNWTPPEGETEQPPSNQLS